MQSVLCGACFREFAPPHGAASAEGDVRGNDRRRRSSTRIDPLGWAFGSQAVTHHAAIRNAQNFNESDELSNEVQAATHCDYKVYANKSSGFEPDDSAAELFTDGVTAKSLNQWLLGLDSNQQPSG
jgi:hypothetical protein